MAEPGKRPFGADVGGISGTADAGIADALQREAERKDADASGRASTGDATGPSTGPVLDAGGKNESGSSGGASSGGGRSATPREGGRADAQPLSTGAAFADEKDEWRHAPVEPRDETNPLKSLGKAIGDTVTGSEGSPPPGGKPGTRR